MKEYVATFFAHFGAVRFHRLLKEAGTEARLQPVPRSLSSSCGSCVRYRAEEAWPPKAVRDEVEQIVEIADGAFLPVFRAEDS